MCKLLSLAAIILLAAATAAAQSEAELKNYFEGRHVTLKIDVPATKDGVNLYPERAQPLDYSEYAARLKRHGVSIRRGESIMVTKVKVKSNHVEFQLGGGGYGTFGDETDAHVFVPSTPKTRREKRLEDELKRETDPARRRRLKEEIADLRREREREDRLNEAAAAEAEEARRARIEEKALRGGGRFNIHFSGQEPRLLNTRMITEALRKYVDFSASEEDTEQVSLLDASYVSADLSPVTRGVVSVGPRSTYIKAGLSEREVLRLLGQPSAVSRRAEAGAALTTYEFPRGEGRVIVAEFVDEVLVSSRTESRGRAAKMTGALH